MGFRTLLLLDSVVDRLSNDLAVLDPLAPRQSVYVQPRQGSSGTGSSRLQGFEFVQGLVETFGEMGLISGARRG